MITAGTVECCLNSEDREWEIERIGWLGIKMIWMRENSREQWSRGHVYLRSS